MENVLMKQDKAIKSDELLIAYRRYRIDLIEQVTPTLILSSTRNLTVVYPENTVKAVRGIDLLIDQRIKQIEIQ